MVVACSMLPLFGWFFVLNEITFLQKDLLKWIFLGLVLTGIRS